MGGAANNTLSATCIEHNQEDDWSTSIRFRVNKSVIDLTYLDNTNSIEALTFFVDSLGVSSISEITIASYASPDGKYYKNLALAGRRTVAIKELLKKISPELEGKIKVADEDESWNKMQSLIVSDTFLSELQREAVLAIITSDEEPDVKERKIKALTAYPYIKENLLPLLRYSDLVVTYQAQSDRDSAPAIQEVTFAAKVALEPSDRHDALIIPETFYSSSATSLRREIVYARTNLLSPISNVGVEYCINNNWSIGADWYFPWIFRNADHKNCFQILGGGLEGRYWFGKERTEQDRLEGHSVGLNASLGYYDFERNFAGKQGEFINVGVDYLYSLPVCKDKLHLEFSIGLGYIYSNLRPYDVFQSGGLAFRKGYYENFHWFGPNKAAVSLVVPITAKRRADR